MALRSASYTARMKILSAVLTLYLISFCSAALGQWQWLDKDGRIVFSDRGPSPEVPDKDILKRPNIAPKSATPADRNAIENEGGGAIEGAPATVRLAPVALWVDKDMEGKKKQATEAQDAKIKSEQERLTRAKIENCARAKQAKTALDYGIRISRSTASGEREVLDDAARTAELKHIRHVIESDCK
jgi:hypothetical protein